MTKNRGKKLSTIPQDPITYTEKKLLIKRSYKKVASMDPSERAAHLSAIEKVKK